MDAVNVVAVIDNNHGHEALYLAGNLTFQDSTIYMCDLARITEGRLIKFSQVSVELPDNLEWPDQFEDLEKYLSAESSK
jgi:hypothetical protein